MTSYGQHMERLERQAQCEHVWSPWRPYPGSAAGLLMRDCRRCWKTEARSPGELERPRPGEET